MQSNGVARCKKREFEDEKKKKRLINDEDKRSPADVGGTKLQGDRAAYESVV